MLAGASDGEILEVDQVCACFNCSNRLLTGRCATTRGDRAGSRRGDGDDARSNLLHPGARRRAETPRREAARLPARLRCELHGFPEPRTIPRRFDDRGGLEPRRSPKRAGCRPASIRARDSSRWSASASFPRTWTGAAFEADVPAPGDAIPVSVAGVPIIILRDESGTVRAFHNVCRHRATLVLTEPCRRLRQLQCPYHAWTYGLDGALRATPFWDGTAKSERQPVDADRNGLVPVRCGVWNHVIFVNLADNAAPLEEYLAPMAAEFSHLDMAALRCGYRNELGVQGELEAGDGQLGGLSPRLGARRDLRAHVGRGRSRHPRALHRFHRRRQHHDPACECTPSGTPPRHRGGRQHAAAPAKPHRGPAKARRRQRRPCPTPP